MKKYFKIISNSIAYTLRGISYLIPRNKDKWVVGNSRGFNNNTKYFFIHAKTVLEKNKCYWISKNKSSRKIVRTFGFKAYHPWSITGIYHLLTAGVYIYDSRVSALNYWVSGGAKFVNLWHGVGIKNIEFAGQVKPFPAETCMNKFLKPVIYLKPDLFLSTSPLMTRHFCKCFRISPQQCIESSYPRNEILQWEESRLLEFIQKYEPKETMAIIRRLKKATQSFIYMPTFRDENKNFLEQSGIDLKKLNDTLKAQNKLFILKLHPFTRINMDLCAFDHILTVNNKTDIYPILPFTDVLITDYSSIYFDYLLMKNKSILLFPFDYQKYIEEDRDLAFDFVTYMPGQHVYNFNALIETIKSGKIQVSDKNEWIRNQFWYSPHPQNLYDAISRL